MKAQFKLLLLVFFVFIVSAFIYKVNVEGLKVGQKAPNFEGKDQNGKVFRLSEALQKGPVVMFFYRGEWCPFCNRYIKNIQDSISFIYQKGASVVGISPEKSDGIQKTIKKTSADFPLVFDEDNEIGKLYNTYNSETGLPVPATYVIGKDRKVKYVHFNKVYQIRATVREILEAL
jgi:peroxiredoxin